MKRTMFITRDKIGKRSGAKSVWLWAICPVKDTTGDVVEFNRPADFSCVYWEFDLKSAATLFGVNLMPGEIRKITIETE